MIEMKYDGKYSTEPGPMPSDQFSYRFFLNESPSKAMKEFE